MKTMGQSQQEKSKRQRTVNFAREEKLLLANIVAKYKDIVENKRTDAVGVSEKKVAWENITKEFNSSGLYYPRDIDSLKRLYDNKKKQIRKQAAEEKKEFYKTGGGLPPKICKEPCDEVLLSIINKKSIHGLTNEFDCDALTTNATISSNYKENTLLKIDADVNQNDIEFIYEEENTGDHSESEVCDKVIVDQIPTNEAAESHKTQWKKYKPDDFRKPMTNLLRSECQEKENKNANQEHPKNKICQVSRRRPATIVKALSSSHLAEKYELLLDKRLAIAKYEEKKIQNDIECNKKEHELRVESLKLDIEIKKKTIESMGKQK